MIERPIFIGGMPRSGTTLLRAMLDKHPNIACGPELRVIPALSGLSAQTRNMRGDIMREYYDLDQETYNKILRDLIASFLEPYLKSRNKKRVAEKTPANVLHFPELSRCFPDADFIHVIRDGRDVVSSLMTMHWKDARTGAPMEITTNPAAAAATWKYHLEQGIAAKRAGLRLLEVQYEALVNRPADTLKQVFEFLGEDWCEESLDYFNSEFVLSGANEASAPQISKPLYSESIGRWRRDLSAIAKSAIKQQAGPLLRELGYAKNDAW